MMVLKTPERNKLLYQVLLMNNSPNPKQKKQCKQMSKDTGKERIKNLIGKIKKAFRKIVHYFITEQDNHYPEWVRQFVYKIKQPPKDMEYYRKRILELSDGCSVKELIQRLYCEEKNHGGAVAGIGLVESAWKEETAKEIEQLMKDKYLHCEKRILSSCCEAESDRRKI